MLLETNTPKDEKLHVILSEAKNPSFINEDTDSSSSFLYKKDFLRMTKRKHIFVTTASHNVSSLIKLTFNMVKYCVLRRSTLIYILIGQDDFTTGETLKRIKKGIGDEALLEANTTLLEAEGLSPERLRAECSTVPFMTEKRLVIVNGLLERFHPREKSAAATKKSTARSKEDGYKSFAEVMQNLPPSTVLVLLDTAIKDRDIRDTKKLREVNPLFREIEPGATIDVRPQLAGERLNMWIQVRVTDLGGNIAPPAVTSLARLIGGNLWIMSNEIAKLVLFAQGRRIEEKDVNLLVASARESNVFNLIDAVFDGKLDVALDILRQLLQAGESPSQHLFMLARQMQLIVRLKDMKEHGRPKMEMQSRLGLMQEFAWLRTAAQAERFTFPHLKEIYRKLLETDLAIKTGKYDGDTALSILIAELSARENPVI
jgi:DNA polymerase-3 subunit delta